MHTAEKADWEKTASRSLNPWQQVALKTHGVITPGNVTSFAGGISALYGLWVILNGDIVSGLIFLAIGRVADLADGIIAEYTKTKSPLGEMIDATIDKFVVAAALIVLGALELIPWIIIVIIALQNFINLIASIIARLRDRILHPSRIGKVSAALSWVTIILYPVGDWLGKNEYSTSSDILIAISLISFLVYVVLGYRASFTYAMSLYRKPAKKLYSLFR